MLKNDKETEPNNARFIAEYGKLRNRFDYFLSSQEVFSGLKINFDVSYSFIGGHYYITILPAREGFDSQKYFMDKFETEEGQSKLAEFADKNNVGLITY